MCIIRKCGGGKSRLYGTLGNEHAFSELHYLRHACFFGSLWTQVQHLYKYNKSG